MPIKYIQYDKDTKRILSISDGLNQGPFQQKELTISNDVIEKMTGGFYNSFYRGGHIILEKNGKMKRLEKKEDIKNMIAKIKLGSYTPEELAGVLEKLTE